MEKMVIGPRKLLFAMIFVLAAVGVSSANNVYLAQSAQGSGNGSSCSNAYAVSYFNTSGNWTTGTPSGTQIGPGTTVYLCSGGGEITTNLNFQGNGASGSRVVLDCNSGSPATMDAYIDIGTAYWTLQNCTWDTGYATLNQDQAVVQMETASYGLIQKNTINIQASAQIIFLGANNGLTHDITIQNNTLEISTNSVISTGSVSATSTYSSGTITATFTGTFPGTAAGGIPPVNIGTYTTITPSGCSVSGYNGVLWTPTAVSTTSITATASGSAALASATGCTIKETGDNLDTDGIDTEGSYNVLVQGNYIAMNDGAGQQACGGCHDDMMQFWARGSGSESGADSPYNWTVRYNVWYQESDPNKTSNLSFHMIQGLKGYLDIYGNVYLGISGGSGGNGLDLGSGDSNDYATTINVYNNSIAEYSGGINNLIGVATGGVGVINLNNNIIYTTQATALNGSGNVNRTTNLWYSAGTGSIPSCSGTSDICGSNPDFNNVSNYDLSLVSGSPALSAGTNEGATWCNYGSGCNNNIIPETTWPNPSLGTWPTSGNWNIGAYGDPSGDSPPAPPTALSAVVQ